MVGRMVVEVDVVGKSVIEGRRYMSIYIPVPKAEKCFNCAGRG